MEENNPRAEDGEAKAQHDKQEGVSASPSAPLDTMASDYLPENPIKKICTSAYTRAASSKRKIADWLGDKPEDVRSAVIGNVINGVIASSTVVTLLLTFVLAAISLWQGYIAREALKSTKDSVVIAQRSLGILEQQWKDAIESAPAIEDRAKRMTKSSEDFADAAKTQAGASEKSANAAIQSMRQAGEYFREDLRPRISLIKFNPPECVTEKDKPTTCQVIWTWAYANFGKTSANNLGITNTITINRTNGDPLICRNSLPNGSPVAPNMTASTTALCSEKISLSEFNELFNTFQGITLSGALSYDDGRSRKYETGFCVHRANTGAIMYCKGNYLK